MLTRLATLAFVAVLTAGEGSQLPSPALPHVILETSLGTIELEIDAIRAPLTAANFLNYVDAKLYDGGRFHRTVRADNQPQNDVKIDVVQAGTNPARAMDLSPPIPLERTSVTKLSHVDGALSMARSRPETGRSDFFICIGNQPELDFGGKRNADGQGFAVFGRVVKGMDVVRKIQASPANGQTLTPGVPISSARRIPPS